MALFGKARTGRNRPASPYPTRNPAQIMAMNEAMSEGGEPDPYRASEAPKGQGNEAGPLGASMRSGFDYAGAARALAGPPPEEPSNGLGTRLLGEGWGQKVAALGSAMRGNNQAIPQLMAQKQFARDGQQARLQGAAAKLAEWQYQDYSRQHSADLKAAAPFTIGRDRVQFDPASGQSNVLFDGSEDFELYAQRLGLKEGTEEYYNAVEDYVLRSSGPSAHGRDKELDDYRTGNDEQMERLRFDNRQSMERLRQGNRMQVASTRGQSRAVKPSTDLPVIASPAEAANLPSGTRFKTPDGRVKVKP